MHIEVSPYSEKYQTANLFSSFLGGDFREPKALGAAKKNVGKQFYEREKISNILFNYNSLLGNDEIALQNALKLAQADSCCVVTGQQLGMMSGPAYTILKGISCLSVAKQTGAIPVFWVATEDHDISEIDHTCLIDSMGNLKHFHITLPKDGRPVEDLTLTVRNIEEIKSFLNYLELENIALPSVGDLYSEAMIKVLVQLFNGTGMVFLEPKLLRPLSTFFFLREVKECEAIQNVLLETTGRLKAAGGQSVIDVGEATHLFLRDKHGKRVRLRFDGHLFRAGCEKYPLEKLVDIAYHSPEFFSTNVAARPMLQNLLLPVIAYIAGPTELAYHCQLADYHKFHGIAMPCLIPRLSATFIPPYAAKILKTCALNPWENIPSHWGDVMPSLQVGEKEMREEWFESAKRKFSNDLSTSSIERYVKLGSRKLMRRVFQRRLNREGLPYHGLHLLNNVIHPHHDLQERLLNWWTFQGKSQENLILECLQKMAWDTFSHHYIYL